MKARGNNQKRKRKEKPNPLYLHRQQKRSKKNSPAASAGAQNQQQRQRQQPAANAFEQAFGHMQMTEAMQRRDQEINQEVLCEMELDVTRHLAERARTGDAVATDGTLLFTRQSTGAVLHNNGDNSQNARTRYTNLLGEFVEQEIPNAATTGTPCCIPGCQWSQNVPDHRCYRSSCTRLVHNLCAQSNNLTDDEHEVNMYCSRICKAQGRHS